MKPEVSVIIPTYNSACYIAKALGSVLTQSYQSWEIILIDDGSTDATLSIVRSFTDSRLKIIENQRNRGVSYGRNLGIQQARGKWIALLDSDDWYAPQRLERLVAIAEAKNADLVADNLWLIDEGKTKPWSSLLAECSAVEFSGDTWIDAIQFVTSDRLPPIDAKRSWSLGYAKPLIKREFLLRHQIRYDEELQVGEDFTIYLECLRHQARFYLTEQPYYYYRTRAVSLSTRKPTQYLAESCEIAYKFVNREVVCFEQSQLLKALLENIMLFQKRLTFYLLLDELKNKQLLTAIAQIAEHPYVIADLYFKSLAVLKRKLKAIYTRKPAITSDESVVYPELKQWLQELR